MFTGGSIGAGLFVGSGGALRTGGPGSVLLGFIIIGFMLLCTMQALGELAGEFTQKSIPLLADFVWEDHTGSNAQFADSRRQYYTR
jgi:amino acid transporter